MFRFFTSLFASESSTRPAATAKFRPHLSVMEDRYTPAVVTAHPLLIRGFDPQPEPPTARRVVADSSTSIPGVYIPGGSHTNGIVIAGGLTARGIVIAGG